ncbi:MAG: metal ABC transporter substrate-binding protein [Endomicrobiia bacterium]
MRKIKFIFLIIFFCFRFGNSDTKKIKIVATTTNISSIVKEIAKNKVEVIEIIPYKSCPGHFDLSIRDFEKILDADLFIYHGWEVWVKKILDKTKKNYKVSVEKNLMLPQTNIVVGKEILEILCKLKSENKEYFEKNYEEYCNKVNKYVENVKQKFKKYSGYKVICSEYQKEFLSWLGFEVVYSYPRQEQLSLKDIRNIFSFNGEIVFVADNLQSGPNIAKQIAKDLKTRHIVLTNFVKDDYIKTLKENIIKIEKVLK